jgi:hypothetical protein
MKYATCIITNPEGFGSLFQYILSCYFLCKVYNLQFVYTDIKNFEHMTWDGYTSQDEWDAFWNKYIINVFLPRNEIILYKDLDISIYKVYNNFDLNSYDNTLFIFEDRFLTKRFLDQQINISSNIIDSLIINYNKNIQIETYYNKNKINIALHIRRLTKTDCCNADIRELYLKGNKFDLYYYNMIIVLKDLFKDNLKEFHIFTQIDVEEIDMFEHYFKLKDEYSKIILHKGNNTISDIHHMISADILIMAKSSLSVIANYYSKGISIIRGSFQHSVKNTNTIVNDIEGNLTHEQKLLLKNKIPPIQNDI